MSVHTTYSTLDGGVTPICSACNISLCWDISDFEYLERKEFWDNWTCKDCKDVTIDE